MATKNEHEHIGSTFDDFLAEDGLLSEVEGVALKRVIFFQLSTQATPPNEPILKASSGA